MRNKKFLAYGVLVITLLAVFVFSGKEAKAHTGDMSFTHAGFELNGIYCGGAGYDFSVSNHSKIWLEQTKNGRNNFSGALDVPIINFRPECNRDEGTYESTAYELNTNGTKGSLISGPVSFIIAKRPTFPSLPDIGEITVLGTGNIGFHGRPGNRERMASIDYITILVKDSRGNPYPDVINSTDGSLQAHVVLNIFYQRGDGVECGPSVGGTPCNTGGNNISQGQTTIGIPTNKSLTPDPVLVPGAPIPGRVTMTRIFAETFFHWDNPWGGPNNQERVTSNQSNPNLYLFTVAGSPTISSLNKSSVRRNETVTVNGSNFDVSGAGQFLWSNRVAFDLNRQTLQSPRLINNFSGQENLVHYCSKDRMKIEVPEDLPLGAHTVTIINEFGYTNTVNLEVVSGTATPENDPECGGAGGKIDSITPTSGPLGTIVTIRGSGFGTGASSNTNVVKFNNSTAVVTGVNLTGTEIRALVPPDATTGRVTVQPAGKFLIVGPVYTVSGSGGGGGGTGGGGGGSLTLLSVTRDEFVIGEQNTVILNGTGFDTNTALSSDDKTLTFSNETVSSDGKIFRVVVTVGATTPHTAKLRVLKGGNFVEKEVKIITRNSNAPVVSGLSIIAVPDLQEAEIFITGQNFTTGTVVEILGVRNVVLDSVEILSTNQILARVKVFDFDVVDVLGLVKRVRAATVNSGCPAVVNVGNQAGGTVASIIDCSKLTVAAVGFSAEENPTQLGKTGFEGICDKSAGLAKCIQQLYVLSLGLGAIVALFMIVLAGYRYMTAQGNSQQVEGAKESFGAAFIGLIVLFIGYILLYIINPDLVTFRGGF